MGQARYTSLVLDQLWRNGVRIYELALAEKDYPTQAMLQWFITEQVEEEITVTELIEQLKRH